MVGLARARTRPGSAQGDGRAQGCGHAPAGGEREPPGARISLFAYITIRVYHYQVRVYHYTHILLLYAYITKWSRGRRVYVPNAYSTRTQRRAYTPAAGARAVNLRRGG